MNNTLNIEHIFSHSRSHYQYLGTFPFYLDIAWENLMLFILATGKYLKIRTVFASGWKML